jgi:N-methylhydantoinase B
MAGELALDNGARPNPKSQIELARGQTVFLNLPGGGGYGDPFNRDQELVRQDVIAGYVTPETAARDYGVVVRFTGRDDELVRLPHQWVIDNQATAKLRQR